MSHLTLNQLIQIANLSEDTKKDILANLEKMNDDQKLRISQICWENIARRCENEARLEYERMLEGIADGKTQPSPEEFTLIEDRVLTKLLSQIEGFKTSGEISSVKQEIQQHIKKPPQ